MNSKTTFHPSTPKSCQSIQNENFPLQTKTSQRPASTKSQSQDEFVFFLSFFLSSSFQYFYQFFFIFLRISHCDPGSDSVQISQLKSVKKNFFVFIN